MDEKKLFIGSIAWATTEDGLRDLFSQAGTVESVAIIKDKFSGRSKGFGFVEMSSADEAQKAIEMFNNYDLDGRSIVVNVAKPREPRS